MASPDYKGAVEESSWLVGKLPPRQVILPWRTRPANSAKQLSLWEGAQNAQIKNDSANRSPLPIFAYGAKVKLIDTIKLAMNQRQSIEKIEPEKLSPAKLHELYSDTLVPQHRYLASSLTEAVNSPELAPHPSKWFAGISGIDLSRLVAEWLNTNRSTEYEQLYCIGLDADTGQLSGVLTVKRGKGYSGGPCTAGSREYVAFWVDWGRGFQHEGTASVTVHDFGGLPPAGLEYNVSLPIDLRSRVQGCSEGKKTVKVRAVLSWNTPPSTADPNAPVVWGNIIESQIQIPCSQQARTDNRTPCLATAGAAEIDGALTDGRIVDAAIRALKGMAFGSHAGLTVVPKSTDASAFVTDRSFTINAKDIDDENAKFTLYVWNHSNINRGITSSFSRSEIGICTQENS